MTLNSVQLIIKFKPNIFIDWCGISKFQLQRNKTWVHWMLPEQSLPLLFYIWTKLKQGTRYAGQYSMVQSSWVMESLEQRRMLTNQLAWLEKFFDCSRSVVRISLFRVYYYSYSFSLWDILLFTYNLKSFQYISILQFINDLHALVSPNAPGTPLPLILLGKVIVLLV